MFQIPQVPIRVRTGSPLFLDERTCHQELGSHFPSPHANLSASWSHSIAQNLRLCPLLLYFQQKQPSRKRETLGRSHNIQSCAMPEGDNYIVIHLLHPITLFGRRLCVGATHTHQPWSSSLIVNMQKKKKKEKEKKTHTQKTPCTHCLHQPHIQAARQKSLFFFLTSGLGTRLCFHVHFIPQGVVTLNYYYLPSE